MAIFVVLWSCLLVTKLSCLQKYNFGHTNPLRLGFWKDEFFAWPSLLAHATATKQTILDFETLSSYLIWLLFITPATFKHWQITYLSILCLSFLVLFHLFLTCYKGHLISKCFFGVFNSPKSQTKNNSTWGAIVVKLIFFSFFFWENWRYQKDISKLTDLQWVFHFIFTQIES